MEIVPDGKDWTWVLERACPDCGFDASAVLATEVPGLILANAGEWEPVLKRPDVRARPTEDRWSPLEYACHVRDVFRLYDERLRLMLDTENPLFANWDQDATAVDARYSEQDPAVVMEELRQSASILAERFARLSDADWARTGSRSDGVHFTVNSFSRYLIHDPIHHIWDVS